MNKLQFKPLAAVLTSLVFLCNANEIAFSQSKASDGSVAAITGSSAKLPLNKIKLPEGFSISVYAEVEGARSMVMSPSGTLFVGTKGEGKVYAVKDIDGDKIADKKWVIASGLNNPNGVALKNGSLFVAEISRVTKFPNIEQNLANPGKGDVIYDKFPTDWPHGWKYIAFGPDGKLYVPTWLHLVSNFIRQTCFLPGIKIRSLLRNMAHGIAPKKAVTESALLKLKTAKPKDMSHLQAAGWMKLPRYPGGRPVDVLVLPDGSMLVSDDTAGVIYRISYKK